MDKVKFLTLIIVIAVVLQALVPYTKALLLVSEEFKQIPIKPLGLLTPKPEHERVELETKTGKVIADIYKPKHLSGPEKPRPAIIMVLGVKASDEDKKIIFHFQETMARLGYIVMWPRLAALDKEVSTLEEPETLVTSFEYLESSQDVDPKRISFVGFSVGSSVALIAAADQRISSDVHSLMFFGGYFDIFEYLDALATKSMIIDGETVSWQPHEGAINHVTEILKAKKIETLLKYVETGGNIELEETEANELKEINPREFVADFKAPIFILHEKADTYVPYAESIKLRDALLENQVKKFHLANLFEHVQPNKEKISREILLEFAKLYGFLVEVLRFI